MTPVMLLEGERIGRQSADGSWLLRGISLRVRAGQRLAIVGPTGAGKSLLLRALALLDPIDEGRVLFEGGDILNDVVPEFRRKVVYLHQKPVLMEGDVESNLKLATMFRPPEVERNRFSDQLSDWLDRLELDRSFLKKRGADLSGGESQLVALLRAMLLDPLVLLLDEPTAALDAASTTRVENIVEHWLNQQEGKRSVVWVSHNAEQCARVADGSVRIDNGELQEANDAG